MFDDPLISSTYQSLTDPHLFTEPDHSFRLKVINKKCQKTLTLSKLNFLQRIVSWFGFGDASLNKVNAFLHSPEGKNQLNAISDAFKTQSENLQIDFNKVQQNLKKLQACSSRHNQSLIGRLFSIIDPIFSFSSNLEASIPKQEDDNSIEGSEETDEENSVEGSEEIDEEDSIEGSNDEIDEGLKTKQEKVNNLSQVDFLQIKSPPISILKHANAINKEKAVNKVVKFIEEKK